MLKPLSSSLVAIFALSVAVASPKVGPFGVDTVSAATGVTPITPTTTTKTTTYSTLTSITRILKVNSTGNDVKLLQTSLNSKGYKLTADGIFGPLTLAAVKNYQSKNGLKVDGLVGPATLAKLSVPLKPAIPPVVVPPVVTPPVDVVTTASIVNTATAFESAIGKAGKWIICPLNDLTINKDLVLEGEFKNGKKDAVTGAEIIQRKIGLYTQDDKRVVTARFTLTAPKLTINSPKASIEHGTFKGDLYVTTADFKLIDTLVVGNVYVSATNFTLSKEAKIQGNIYFATQGAKDTFKVLDTSSVTGKQELTVVDAVATASIVNDATAFEKAISKDGKWIICSLGNITTTKELVLEGVFKKAPTDLLTQRKIGLYTQAKQDGSNVVTAKFTLTAPKLTIKSPNAKLQSSIFKGELHVNSINFQLIDTTIVGDVYVHSTDFNLTKKAKIEGNVYFDNLEAQKTFKIEAGSSVTGAQKLLDEPVLVDSVASASLVDNAAAFEKAISKDGTWIICPVKDMVINKELVLEGTFVNGKKDAVTGLDITQRKIGIYYHDADNITTAKFTLTAPSLTIKSPKATLQKGTFIGDLYVAAEGFTLKETKVIGNVYFATQALKDAFVLDTLSSISGTQSVKTK